MTSVQARNIYRQTEKLATIHPVKLVHLMYERVLIHLDLVLEGVEEHDPVKRGENLGRAIAIVTELNASIRKEDASEAAEFLRGLYSAILVELPKVAVNNDGEVVRRARRYLAKLKEIWEQTAMREHGFSVEERGVSQPVAAKTTSPPERTAGGLSVSI